MMWSLRILKCRSVCPPSSVDVLAAVVSFGFAYWCVDVLPRWQVLDSHGEASS